MSNEPKGTDKLQSEIAKEFRNMNSKPGLEIGLRPELGTFELCDKHYDASRTESEEHCAVCQLEAEKERYRQMAEHYFTSLDHSDTCRRCGADICDPVHIRGTRDSTWVVE